ncbi:MAG: hypothetical protein K6E10_02850 [Eubacterium sp.]|nr:hypothetical protein [Eubacterium sp.]
MKKYAITSANGHEFTGIIDSERLSVIEVTEKFRKKHASIKKDLYVVEDLCIDHIVIWQDETGTIYETVLEDEPKKIAGSLKDYLESF